MIPNPKLDPPTLTGQFVRLRPVVSGDAAVYAAATPIETFRYYVSQMPKEQSEKGFRAFVDFIVDSPNVQGFACELLRTGEVIGGSTFMDIRLTDCHVEVGMTWYKPEWRGTFVNPECKLLMLTYAFETLGCVKVTLKCDNRNENSKAAILKLGAKHEGVLRRHKITDLGEWRDTSYYGILSEEWPEVKAKLEARLAQYE
jgi:RimJ/RimL family protein N-acetyltransferase